MLGRSCTGPSAPRAGGCLREEDEEGLAAGCVRQPRERSISHGTEVCRSARAEGNPDKARRSKSSPQADALLLATIKAVGIVQPPVVAPETDGGNGYVIDAGHRRVKQAIAAGLEEIAVLVIERDNGGDALAGREHAGREQLNPVDQWRAIERLVALGWTEEAIAVALACRFARSASCACSPMSCRPCSTRWPRATCPTSSSCAPSRRPRSTTRRRSGRSTSRRRPTRRSPGGASRKALTEDPHVCQGCELRRRSGAGLRHRLGRGPVRTGRRGQPLHHRCRGLPRRAAGVDDAQPAEARVIVEVNSWGQPELPKKAERKSTASRASPTIRRCTSIVTARCRRCTTACRRRRSRRERTGERPAGGDDDTRSSPKTRPDVTRKGIEMIGDLRTDALHEALSALRSRTTR
jgi:ParB family chromosome partitioning protein